MKNGFDETPIENNLYNLPLQIRIKKTQNMKILNECIRRRKFKTSQEEVRKDIEEEVRKLKVQNKKYRNRLESAISKDILSNCGSTKGDETYHIGLTKSQSIRKYKKKNNKEKI
jgi:hypothetical protein